MTSLILLALLCVVSCGVFLAGLIRESNINLSEYDDDA